MLLPAGWLRAQMLRPRPVQVTKGLEPDMTDEPVAASSAAKSPVEETVDLPFEETPGHEGASDVPNSNVPDSPSGPAQPDEAAVEASSSSSKGAPPPHLLPQVLSSACLAWSVRVEGGSGSGSEGNRRY